MALPSKIVFPVSFQFKSLLSEGLDGKTTSDCGVSG